MHAVVVESLILILSLRREPLQRRVMAAAVPSLQLRLLHLVLSLFLLLVMTAVLLSTLGASIIIQGLHPASLKHIQHRSCFITANPLRHRQSGAFCANATAESILRGLSPPDPELLLLSL